MASAKPPNVVMIAIDDLNDFVGVYGGHKQAITPNIDRLAAGGMVFRNASCPGPVCGTSRSALLSGFMPSTTGIYGNSQNMLDSPIVQRHATLPEYFSRNGYVTLSSGKIFHKHATDSGQDHGHWAFDVWQNTSGNGKPDPKQLFDRNRGIINGKRIANPKHADGGGSPFAFGPTIAGIEDQKDYRTAQWFAKKLSQDHAKPFFMAVGFSKPHLAWHVPQEFFDLYERDQIEVPAYRLDDFDDIAGGKRDGQFRATPDFLWCQEYGVMKDAVRAYLASVSFADACAGVVLDALAKSQYADNTIVILWGDHGWHLGEKLRFRKVTLWREATQCPLIVRMPSMTQSQSCDRNVNLIDLYPTLIDLCGLPDKGPDALPLDGRSFAPLLRDPSQSWHPTVTTKRPGEHSVMADDWHYIHRDAGPNELYRVNDDPMEWTNLLHDDTSQYESVINRLRSSLPKQTADPIRITKKSKRKKSLDHSIRPHRLAIDLQ
ncbi:MAG: sulfatase [Planctomycetota bacterium]